MPSDRSHINSFRYSLRAKVTLGVVLPLLLLLGLFTLIEYQRHQAIVLKNLSVMASQSGQVIEDNLRLQMVNSDFAAVQNLLDSISESEGFRIIDLIDTSGKVIFAPHQQGVGSQMNNHQPDCLPCHRLPPDKRPASIVVTTADGQRVFRSMHPIENGPQCARCHGDQRLIGLLLTDISTAPLEASLNADLRENLLWWGITILVVVAVVNLALSHFVLSRLERLATAIRSLGQGQSTAQVPEDQPDEIGHLARRFNQMAQQIEARNAENLALSESLQRQSAQRGELLKSLISAQEDERRRVARELHDELGQTLAGLALQMEAMQRLVPNDPERAVGQMQQTRASIADATDRMYDLILALRPSALDDLGLAAALRSHAERSLEGSQIHFQIDVGKLEGRLPVEMETSLYRIFQEALSNVIRHAHATEVHIELARQNGDFRGVICDNGQGFDPATVQADGENPRGLGLLGMQERVAQLGGCLEIHSSPGAGTTIVICIPVAEGNS
jgi:signal transduction histidine kinase